MCGVWRRVDNGRVGWEWGDCVYGMCGRTVQQHIDGGVCSVWGGIGDGHTIRRWRQDMYGVWHRAV
jgi:hypothetical protein